MGLWCQIQASPEAEISISQRQHNPRVRMVTTGGHSTQSSLSSQLTVDSQVDSGKSNITHNTSTTGSYMTSTSPNYLLEAAKEITSEMGFSRPKKDISYPYLTQDNHTFKTPAGVLSTTNSDWHTVIDEDDTGPVNQSEHRYHQNKCVLTEKSHPLISVELYYRIKCWIENGTFGIESLPGHKHGAPRATAHPDQYVQQAAPCQLEGTPAGFISLGKFLPSFADSYVVPVNICGFNSLLTIDSGCSGCLASHLYLIEALGEDFYRYLRKYTGDRWFSADGSPITVLGTFVAKIRLETFTCSQEVVVYRSTTKELLFGARFLKKYSIHITPTQLIIPLTSYQQHNEHQRVKRLTTEEKPIYSLLLKADEVIPPLSHQPIQAYIPAASLSPADVHSISTAGLIAHSEELENVSDPDKMSIYYSMVHFSKNNLNTTLLYSNHTEDIQHLQKGQLIAHAELMDPVAPALIQAQGSPVLQVVQHLLQPRAKHSLPDFENFYYESPELLVDERDFDNINVESSDPSIKAWVKELCLRNKEAFARNKWDIGRTEEQIHCSVRSSCSPHQGKGYAVSPRLVEKATQMLSALLSKGLLDYASNTSWSSNCFFVLKKNIEQDKDRRKDPDLAMEKKTNISQSYLALRMIIDLRQVNLALKKTYTVWPLATTKSILYNLQTCKIATAYDLNQAFWNMRTTSSTSRILAINWLQKYHLMCLRCPHGLVCASSCLQMLLVKLLIKLGLDLKLPRQVGAAARAPREPCSQKDLYCMAASHNKVHIVQPTDLQDNHHLAPRTPGQSGAGAGNTYVFVDNIISAHQDVETHKKEVKILIEGLKNAGFLLKLKKCFFFISTKLELFSWIVDLQRNLLYPPPARLQELEKLERPKNQRQCRAVVGSLLVYHDALPLINAVLKPLHQLNAHGRTFSWSSEAEKSFQEAKAILAKASLLHLPDFQKPFFLLSDSAKGQYGHYAICQRHSLSNKLVVLKHTSVPYTGATAMYSQVKSELYIAIHALSNNCIFFVYSPSFWVTDAASLQHLIVFRHSNSILHSWSCFLTSLNLQILPVPNTNAHLRFIDYFTRPGATKQQLFEKLQKLKFSPETCDKVPLLDLIGLGSLPINTLFELVDKFQASVKHLLPGKVQQAWKDFSNKGFLPMTDLTCLQPNNILSIKVKDQDGWQVVSSPQQIRGLREGREAQLQEIKEVLLRCLPDISLQQLQLLQEKDRYCVNLMRNMKPPYELIQGLLFKKVRNSPLRLLILPLSLSEQVVQGFHIFGSTFHLRSTKLKAQIQKHFVVQKLNAFVSKCIQTCDFCLTYTGPTKLSPNIPGITVWPQSAARFWHVDHVSICSAFPKYNSVLTCVDVVSGAVVFIPANSNDTDTIIIGQLFTHLVARFGAISGLASDGAGALTSSKLNSICQMMMCKKFTVVSARQNLSENCHFLLLRIFRYLNQKCNLTEELLPLFCGLTAISYNLTISSKHNHSPQKILENYGPITKAVLPAKIPLSSFLKKPHADAFTAASWHCLQFLQMLRHKRLEQQCHRDKQQKIKTRLSVGDFCLLKRPLDTRRRIGMKLRAIMYKNLFKCVQVRLKSVVLLPLLPEKLVENCRKRQGAAPKPKYLLVDIDRCKKVEYPHLYIHPAMSIRDFNILVQKLEYQHEIPRIRFTPVLPTKGSKDTENFLQLFCQQDIFSSASMKEFQVRIAQDYHNFCTFRNMYLKGSNPVIRNVVRVFTNEYMLELKSSINFSSESDKEEHDVRMDGKTPNLGKHSHKDKKETTKDSFSVKNYMQTSLIPEKISAPPSLTPKVTGIPGKALVPHPPIKKKGWPGWRKFHVWPQKSESGSSSSSTFFRILPKKELAEDFFDFLNILVEEVQQDNHGSRDSISQHSSGSSERHYEQGRDKSTSTSHGSQEFQQCQEFIESGDEAEEPREESIRKDGEPREKLLGNRHGSSVSPLPGPKSSPHIEKAEHSAAQRESPAVVSNLGVTSVQSGTVASSSSVTLVVSSTAGSHSGVTSVQSGTVASSSIVTPVVASAAASHSSVTVVQSGAGATISSAPAAGSSTVVSHSIVAPAVPTTSITPSQTGGPKVVSVQIGNPQQLVKDASSTSGVPAHLPAIGPLGQTLARKLPKSKHKNSSD